MRMRIRALPGLQRFTTAVPHPFRRTIPLSQMENDAAEAKNNGGWKCEVARRKSATYLFGSRILRASLPARNKLNVTNRRKHSYAMWLLQNEILWIAQMRDPTFFPLFPIRFLYSPTFLGQFKFFLTKKFTRRRIVCCNCLILNTCWIL